MIYAIILGMISQHPDLKEPMEEELEAVLDHPDYVREASAAMMTNRDKFTADQGGAFLYFWGKQNGLNL